jgi:hypothetical protein
MRTIPHKLLAALVALLLLGALPAHAAVTVYEVYLTQQAMRINPAAIMTINGAALPPAGTASLPTTGGLFAGNGFLYVEGSQIEYYLAMSWLDSLPSLSFVSASDIKQLLLGTPEHYYLPMGTPSLSGYMTVTGPDGTEEQHPVYITNQGLDPRYVYTGSVDDPALAALLAETASGVTVYADGDSGIYRPSGSLTLISSPEPGRMFLLLLGAFAMFCRRRRALGSG